MSREHYGDPLAEMRALARGEALCDVSTLDIVQVAGPDRLVWLNSISSQNFLGLAPGVTTETLVLDPQGHIEHAALVVDDGEATWLLVAAGRGEALATWLSSMKFRMQVEISHEPGAWTILASLTPYDEGVSGGQPAPVVSFSDPWPGIGEGSVGYAPEPHPGASWSLHYGVFSPEVTLESLGRPSSGTLALAGLAIAAGRPSVAEIDGKTLPHECDWLRTAVHLNKGCYRGQETVAKVHNLGHPPRRLTLLHLDGSESILPRAGDTVSTGDNEVGVITQAAWHWELGPIALAMLKRMAPADAVLSVHTEGSEIAASQEVLVPLDAGAARAVPRLPRLGQRGQ